MNYIKTFGLILLLGVISFGLLSPQASYAQSFQANHSWGGSLCTIWKIFCPPHHNPNPTPYPTQPPNGGGGGTCPAIKNFPGIQSITVYEMTRNNTGPANYVQTYNVNDGRLVADINQGIGGRDLGPTTAGEHYDFYYSNANGTLNPNGSYFTTDMTMIHPTPISPGLNLDAVSLNFSDGRKVWANVVSHYEYGASMGNYPHLRGQTHNEVLGQPNGGQGGQDNVTHMGNPTSTITIGFPCPQTPNPTPTVTPTPTPYPTPTPTPTVTPTPYPTPTPCGYYCPTPTPTYSPTPTYTPTATPYPTPTPTNNPCHYNNCPTPTPDNYWDDKPEYGNPFDDWGSTWPSQSSSNSWW